MGGPLRIGIVGVGKISEQYFASLPVLPGLRLVAVADIDAERARSVADVHGVDAVSVTRLMEDPRVDAVLNLTIPAAHVDISLRALGAGKHVYTEKPLALAPVDGASMIGAARTAGLRIGSAPDTVLGTGIQTARSALDRGLIGRPVGATAFWGSPGHERWHPAPAFYYQEGGGPLFDMGPYYLAALVTLLGPVERVSGAALRSPRIRVIGSGPSAGAPIDVNVDTHLSAVLEHMSGVNSIITLSFDVWASRIPNLEIYGTRGTLLVPDPNHFSDPVEVLTEEDPEWRVLAPEAGYIGAGRGFGLADMARAIETRRPHRASAELAYHVLEIMDSITLAGRSHEVVSLRSTSQRPDPVPLGSTPATW